MNFCGIVLNGSDDFLMLMQYMSMMVMMTIAMKQTIKGSFLLGVARLKFMLKMVIRCGPF